MEPLYRVGEQVYIVLYEIREGRTKYYIAKGRIELVITCTMRKDRFKYKVSTPHGTKNRFECDIYSSKEEAINQAQISQSIVDYKIRRSLNGSID